ncbi:MAG TPA: family 20 glycosylhydrolase, partial [Chitinophagales bacterium]|nr:family 20 glycosylhydrolase [Chitinophagales bacterium]
FIKKYIDYLAMYKMNTFHWHLTDDQGWRIEIKQYPKLTEIGAWRDGTMVGHYRDQQYDNVRYGGFYTQKEIREIVRYATDRHITIIPEIEMPGHCMAALAAYPELGCVSDTTYQVAKGWGVVEDVFCPKDSTFILLENVLEEVMALFPSPYIHTGGDEVEKIRWRNCSHCQQLIKEKGLVNEHGLQSYFIQRIEKYVNSKGRSIIGWDEILEGGLAQNATIMSWRGEEGAVLAAQQQHYAIMTPGSHCYFDYYQGAPQLEPLAIGGFVPLDKVYAFNPIPASLTPEQATYILGAQANIWTEYISFPEQVEYMLLPRMLALSEVLWTSNENKNYDDFLTRLLFHFQLLDKTNTNYAKSIYQINYKVTPASELNKLNITLLSNPLLGKIEVQTVNVLNGNKNNFTYQNSFTVDAETPYINAQLTGSIKNTPTTHIKLKFNKATGKSITLKNEPSKKYSADGPFTLVNGVEGTVNPSWNGNEWLGFLGSDLQAIIDLGEVDTIKSVTVGCLFDKLSWIYPAESVQIWISTNGKNYEQAGKIKYNGDQKRNTITVNSSIKTGRYIKIEAINLGNIPSGNPGAGSKPWLFIDEITVE